MVSGFFAPCFSYFCFNSSTVAWHLLKDAWSEKQRDKPQILKSYHGENLTKWIDLLAHSLSSVPRKSCAGTSEDKLETSQLGPFDLQVSKSSVQGFKLSMSILQLLARTLPPKRVDVGAWVQVVLWMPKMTMKVEHRHNIHDIHEQSPILSLSSPGSSRCLASESPSACSKYFKRLSTVTSTEKWCDRWLPVLQISFHAPSLIKTIRQSEK